MTGISTSALAVGHSFSRKQIAVTFTLARPDGSTDSLTLESDYRIRAVISHAGMSTGSELDLAIGGMSLDEMNRLSHVANQPSMEAPRTTNQSGSTVTVRAGTCGHPLTTVFMGQIMEGYADPAGCDPVFHVHARTITLLAAVIPAPISYRGTRPVVSILSDICITAGYQLADHGGWGRTATLTNHYGTGTTLDQLEAVIRACRGTYDLSPVNARNIRGGTPLSGVVNVWGPTYGGVTDDVIRRTQPLISAETGLVGYPRYSRAGVSFSCLLRPDLAFYRPVRLDSKYTPAGWIPVGSGPWNGIWLPVAITHDIATETEGPWHTRVECQRTTLGETIAPTE